MTDEEFQAAGGKPLVLPAQTAPTLTGMSHEDFQAQGGVEMPQVHSILQTNEQRALQDFVQGGGRTPEQNTALSRAGLSRSEPPAPAEEPPPEAGDTLASVNPMEGIDQLTAPVVRPVQKALQPVAQGFGTMQGKAARFAAGQPVVDALGIGGRAGQIPRSAEYMWRTFASSVLGENAYATMDPHERQEVEEAMKSHLGGPGSSVFKFGASTLPMLLMGGVELAAGQTAEGLPALSRLAEAAGSGAKFGGAQALTNEGAGLGTEMATNAGAAAALHFPVEGAGKAIGWVSSRFKGAVAHDIARAVEDKSESLRPLGSSDPTMAVITPSGQGVLATPTVDGTVKASKPFDLEDRKQVQAFLQQVEEHDLAIEGHDARVKRITATAEDLARRPGKAFGESEFPYGPAGPEIASAVKRGLLEGLPKGRGGMWQDPQATVAIAKANGDIHFEPTQAARPKSIGQEKTPGDAVVDTTNGKRATYLGDAKDGKAILQPPPEVDEGDIVSSQPYTQGHHHVAHADQVVSPPEDHDTFGYPEPSPANVRAFLKGVPRPSVPDIQSFFGLSPAEAAVAREKMLRAAPPVSTPIGRAPPPGGGPPQKPPEMPPAAPSMPPPGAPKAPTTDEQLGWLANGANTRTFLEKFWAPIRGHGFNMSAPDTVRSHGIALEGAKAMMGKEAAYLKALKTTSPEMFTNRAFARAVSDFAEGKLSSLALRNQFPVEWAKAAPFIEPAARQMQAMHESLGFDPAQKYLAQRFLAYLDPEGFKRSLPSEKLMNALRGAQRDWGLSEPEAWEAIHDALGTDDPQGVMGALSKKGGAFSRLRERKDLPGWYRDLLTPADGPVRIANTLASQETLLRLRTVSDAIKADPQAWSPVRQDKFVKVPDDLPDRIFGSVKGGFWHRDIDAQLSRPQNLTKAVSDMGQFIQGLARFRKANSVFGPSTFLKHVESMRDANTFAGGLVPWAPKEAAQDISEAWRQLRAYKRNPLLANADAEAVHDAMARGALGQSFAAYETKDRAVRSAINTLMEGKEPNGFLDFANKGADVLFRNGGLAGKATEAVYQNLQDVTQLANYIALRRRFGTTMKPQAAAQLSARRVADSFPNAANTGTLARTVRNNPAGALFMTYATPVLETARRYSLLPSRVANGEKDLAARLLLHHAIQLGLYGGAAYGINKGMGATGGYSAMGWLRHHNGIPDDQVEAARVNLERSDRLYHPAPVFSAFRDENGDPVPFDNAHGSFTLEALKGVGDEDRWYSKAARAGLNILGTAQPEPQTKAMERGLTGLGVLNRGQPAVTPPAPGHPVAQALSAATGAGMVPFSQVAGQAERVNRDVNPQSPLEKPQPTSRVVMRAAGLPVLKSPNAAVATRQDVGELKEIQQQIKTVAADKTLDGLEKARLIGELNQRLLGSPAMQRIQQRGRGTTPTGGGR